MSEPEVPRLGVTLYSFTPDFHAGAYTTEELIAKVAELGLGPGLEIVGFQSIRGFPQMDAERIGERRTAITDSGLEPSCLAVNVDIGLRYDRLLTDDELVDYMLAQLKAAVALGFPTVRMQYNASPKVMERLLPFAERHELRMGMEIHCPSRVDSRWVLAMRELCDRVQSPFLGFIPDFGASTRGISPSLLTEFKRRGAAPELLQAVSDKWLDLKGLQDEDQIDAMGEFMALARTPEELQFTEPLAVFAVGIHGQQEPAGWAELFPYVVHVHGKFFGLDSTGSEPAVPYEELLPVLVDNGYTGYISSEWEGWHWDWRPDGFEMVAAHHRLCRRILESTRGASS